MSTTLAAAPARAASRKLVLLGIGLGMLGVVGLVVQLTQHVLVTPWWLPITGTIALGIVFAAVWQVRSVWRILALVFVGLLAGAEWTLVLSTRLPEYTGPVKVGQPFPAFTVVRADGTAFTQADLEGKENTLLVFFRGRW